MKRIKWLKRGFWICFILICILGASNISYGLEKGTLELIKEAYLAGEIDYQTSLIYKVQSIRKPELIP